MTIHSSILGLPGGSDSKESACNVGDLGLIPVLGRFPGGWHGNPLQNSCLENPHGQRSLAVYSPQGHKESDMTEQLSTHTHTHTHTHCAKAFEFNQVLFIFAFTSITLGDRLTKDIAATFVKVCLMWIALNLQITLRSLNVLPVLNLPIHEHRNVFPFACVFKFFINILQFSVYWSFISLVKSFMYLMIYGVIVKEIIFLIKPYID